MQPTPLSNDFTTLGLSSALVTATQKCGYLHPTPIQAQAIPVILSGNNLHAQAQTGSGKTAAFGLPLLQKIIHYRARPRPTESGNQISNLILVPTRELALQIMNDLLSYAIDISPRIKIISVFGGVNITPQMLALRGGADILVATPGRLLDLASQNAANFSQLTSVVLDEADRLLQLGFSVELNNILARLPKNCQTLLFSATIPAELDHLSTSLRVKSVYLDCTPPNAEPLIQQRAITVKAELKNAALAQLIKNAHPEQVLVFANAKNTCNRLVLKLAKAGITAQALHGDKTQTARNKALFDFKQGHLQVLIATDVAARGIDIAQLTTLINFDLPRSPNDYIHRIGRTGRAGQKGKAISLICDTDEAHFRIIEKRIKKRIVREQIEDILCSPIRN